MEQAFVDLRRMARDAIAWGPTEQALSAANRLKARMMAEAWAPDAAFCERPAA